MHKQTGEIRTYEEKKMHFSEWSEPFHVGKTIEILGLRMVISKVKKLRGEITLCHPAKFTGKIK